VIVCGSRDWVGDDGATDVIGTVMTGVAQNFFSAVTIVHGDSIGADSDAAIAARLVGMEVEPHPADWRQDCRATCAPGHRRPQGDHTICPAAGVYRNQDMIDAGADLVIAFSNHPLTRGTADTIRRARIAGLPVWVIGRQ